jgi:hypothetical protein
MDGQAVELARAHYNRTSAALGNFASPAESFKTAAALAWKKWKKGNTQEYELAETHVYIKKFVFECFFFTWKLLL